MAMDLVGLYAIKISDTEVEEFELVSDVVKYLDERVGTDSAELRSLDTFSQRCNNG